jgi:hypothetical protein
MKDKPISARQRVKDGVGCGVPVRLICNTVKDLQDVKNAINDAGDKGMDAVNM